MRRKGDETYKSDGRPFTSETLTCHWPSSEIVPRRGIYRNTPERTTLLNSLQGIEPVQGRIRIQVEMGYKVKVEYVEFRPTVRPTAANNFGLLSEC